MGDAYGLGFSGLCVFLVPAFGRCPLWVVGVGAFFGLGIKVQEASMLSGSRSTPVGRISPRLVQVTVVVVWVGCVVCCL